MLNGFVTMIHQFSATSCSPCSGLPVLDYNRAIGNKHLLEFHRLLDETIDIREYGGGWLVNDVEFLGQKIEEDDVKHMVSALEGEMLDIVKERGADVRDVLLRRTYRFHFVEEALRSSDGGNRKFFTCDCREYFFTRWCLPSAYMQHREELGLLGEKIPLNGRCHRKRSKNTSITKALEEAADRASDVQPQS
jgi:hypothetical protein